MDREKTIIRTSILGIVGNIILVIGKIIIGIIAASISIITDAVNNLTDAISSIVTIIGTKISNKKPTKKHPYGYGRIEFITSSIIGVIILVAGATAIYESLLSIIHKDKSSHSIYSFIVITIAIIMKILIGIYFNKKGKDVNSGALKASGADALMDSLLSSATLIAAFIAFKFEIFIEGYAGILIGLFIIKTAFEIIGESISKIIGEKIDPEFYTNITTAISENPEVLGVYDLIINSYGVDRHFGSVHVEIRDDISAKEIQQLERSISYMCFEEFNIIMTVGIYASNTNSTQEIEIKEKILKILNEFKDIKQTHGFFVDTEKKIISIDIIIDFDCNNPVEIYNLINNKIKSLYPDYNIQIIQDKDY